MNERRVWRGGSWIFGPVNLRSAYRGRNGPVYRGNGLGFRLVCPSFELESLPTKEKKLKVEDINWITIPGGEILFRDKKIEVPEFSMMETPVTNAMWDEFVNDDYENPEWWEGEIVDNVPGRWDEPDCPRETVNWYQAKAFCRWLSHKLGMECDLPTEEQWFYAATGGDPANTYPWGPEWREGMANTWESGIRRTSSVYRFPHGRTKDGLYDMCGNVWEWTNSVYE